MQKFGEMTEIIIHGDACQRYGASLGLTLKIT
jgi:hypothetical protein